MAIGCQHKYYMPSTTTKSFAFYSGLLVTVLTAVTLMFSLYTKGVEAIHQSISNESGKIAALIIDDMRDRIIILQFEIDAAEAAGKNTAMQQRKLAMLSERLEMAREQWNTF